MFKSFGAAEIILILVIVLIFFGVGKLPQVGAAMGKGIRAFKRSQSGEDDDVAEEEKPAKVVKSTRKKTTRMKKAKES